MATYWNAFVLIALLVAFPISTNAQEPPKPGFAAEARAGQQSVDPTKNVLDLVQALKEMLSELRKADLHLANELRLADMKFDAAARDSETRRVNELAAQKQLFDLELARVLRVNVDSAALLLSTQLKEAKTDLSDRTAKLEQFRWETGGKSAGMNDIFGWLVAAVMGVIALGGLVINMRRQVTPVVPVVVNGNGKK